MRVTLRETCLIFALGLVTLGLDFGCEAHFLGAGEQRHLLNPFNIIDDIFNNIPIIGSPVPGASAGALGPFGPYGVNIPGVNSYDDYMRFLGLSPQGPNFGTIPGPYIPSIPHLPQGGTFGVPDNPQGNQPGPKYPVPSQPLPPHSGTPPNPGNYPPAVSPPQPPRGNSPGTGPAPPQPGSGRPLIPPRPHNKPDKQPGVPGGGSNPPAEQQGGPGAPCLDKPECEPGESDTYIHLIDPRRGKN